MKRTLAAVTFASLLIATTTATAATLGRGAVEWSGSASLTAAASGTSATSAFMADLEYGWCQDRHWEIAPSLNVAGYAGDFTELSVNGIVSGIYNVANESESVVPFLQFGLGFGRSRTGGHTAVQSRIAPLAGAGFRTLVGSSASVNVGLFYEHVALSQGRASGTENLVTVQVGVSVFPRGFGH